MTGEKSSIRGLLSNHYDANEAGGHRKSLAVGSRRRIKEGRTYICKRRSQVRHVVEKKGPLRRAQAQNRTHAQFQK